MFRMNRYPRITYVVLIVYLLVGPITEFAHIDGLSGGRSAQTSLTQHTCGKFERHVSANGRHECLACVTSAGRIALPAVPIMAAGLLEVLTPLHPLFDRLTILQPSRLLPDKRGPPPSICTPLIPEA